jgi:hypothetical protein
MRSNKAKAGSRMERDPAFAWSLVRRLIDAPDGCFAVAA